MAEAQQEKRATRRFALRLPVAVTYAEHGTQEKSAQTRDVSARGISFYVDSPIATGSPIEFTLTLPAEITDRKHPGQVQGNCGTALRWRP